MHTRIKFLDARCGVPLQTGVGVSNYVELVWVSFEEASNIRSTTLTTGSIP